MSETNRETLKRMIEAAIMLSPIVLTAGAVHRLIETSTKSKIASRSTVQRILDRMVESGEARIELKTIEKNGWIKKGIRHYKGIHESDRDQEINDRETAVILSRLHESDQAGEA